MKKYLLTTSVVNILLGIIVGKLLIGYMNISIENNYNTYVDILYLFLIVLIVTIINYLFFKILKTKGKKVYIGIPSIIFMLVTSLCLIVLK